MMSDKVSQYISIYMDIYGWICMDMYGYVWIYMDIYMDNFIKEICRGMGELYKVNFTCLKIVFCIL